MRSSSIVRIAPDALTDESGYVRLGTVDGWAYVHLAPWREPQEVTATWGATLIAESVRPSFADAAEVVYDPTPAPFRWADFAAAHPDLAASPGEDEDGNPLPPALMPHCWAGE